MIQQAMRQTIICSFLHCFFDHGAKSSKQRDAFPPFAFHLTFDASSLFRPPFARETERFASGTPERVHWR